MIDVLFWLIIFFGFAFFVCYKHVTKNHNFFVKRGVAFLKPELFFGSARELFFEKIQVYEYLHKLYDKMPNER